MRWSAAVERRKAKERQEAERKKEMRQRNAARMAAAAGKLPPPPRPARYQVQQRSVGWYNVTGPAGTVNDRAMRKADAENLARGLNDASR